MEAILDFFTGPLKTVAWIYILLPCVMIGGIFFTVRNRGIQFGKFGYAMKHTLGKLFQKQSAETGAVTPFQAVTTALAATVGTGNIIGTGQAIAMGGYGAIFWLWIAALLGMIIKYCEVTLSVRYREKNEKGDWVGGPMYYITNGMGKKWKWLAVLFAILAVPASFGIGNLSQANSISASVLGAITSFFPQAIQADTTISLAVDIILAVVCAVSFLGGIKRIGKITELLVPFMSIFYILCALTVIGVNIGNIGEAFKNIFVGTTTSLEVVWNLTDTFNGLMAIPNFVALFALSGVVARLTKEHFAKNTHRLK